MPAEAHVDPPPPFHAGGNNKLWALAPPPHIPAPRTKVAAHDAVPCGAGLGIEILLNVRRHVLFYRALFQSLRVRTWPGRDQFQGQVLAGTIGKCMPLHPRPFQVFMTSVPLGQWQSRAPASPWPCRTT